MSNVKRNNFPFMFFVGFQNLRISNVLGQLEVDFLAESVSIEKIEAKTIAVPMKEHLFQ